MSKPHMITRRSLLKASPAVAAAAALPVLIAPVQAEEPAAPQALIAILTEYRAAHVQCVEAEREQRAAEDAFNRAIDKNAVYVRTSMAGDCLKLDSDSSPAAIQHAIDRNLEKRKAYEAGMAEQGLTSLASPKSRARAWPRLQAKANEAFAEYERIRNEHKVQDFVDASCDAYDRQRKSKDTLFAYQVTTFAEVKAITAAMYETARITERWYELPGRQLALMLNPQLGKVA